MKTIRKLIVVTVVGITITAFGVLAGNTSAQPSMSNVFNGPVISNPKIHNLFMDWSWDADNPAFSKDDINNFTQTLVNSDYLSYAGQYGVGSASYTGWHDANGLANVCDPFMVPISLGKAEFLDIALWVQCMIAPDPVLPWGTLTGVPAPDDDTLYVVYVPSGVQIWDIGKKTCDDYSAYHFMTDTPAWDWDCTLWHCIDCFCPIGPEGPWCCLYCGPYCGPVLSNRTVAYAVVAADCANNSLDILTQNATHEIIEAATDPIVGTGWYDQNFLDWHLDFLTQGEAADLCSSIGPVPTAPVTMTNGISVSPYWSNNDGACVPFPPVYAQCKDVTVSAGLNCTSSASIDNGSYDSGGGSVTLTQDPLGPYPLGSTTVTLTATNGKGVSNQCSATVTVVDNNPPSITAPAPVIVSTGPGATTCGIVVSDAMLGNATASDNCPGAISISQSGVPAGNIFPVGVSTISYMAIDSNGNIATATQSVTVIDNTPPSISAPSGVTAYTGLGAISCGTVVKDAALGTATATDNCPGAIVTRSGVPSGNFFPVGMTTVTYTAKDAAGNVVTATQNVTIIDNTPPTISGASANPSVLWPPNHNMVPVNVTATASDNCAVTKCNIISVTSNEPQNGLGDGDTAPDWNITEGLSVALRGERSGTGSGRLYTITVECADSAGNSSTGTVGVTVPHDQGKK